MSERRSFVEDAGKVAREEVYSHSVRAGRRTYYFDVKPFRGNDCLLAITESKKRFNRDGRYFYEKHKIYLYKEDFEKFAEGLNHAIEFVSKLQPTDGPETEITDRVEEPSDEYTNFNFEDLEVGVESEEQSNE
jgi:hypothetical protein